jgi:hypothetical protein
VLFLAADLRRSPAGRLTISVQKQCPQFKSAADQGLSCGSQGLPGNDGNKYGGGFW